MGQLQSGGSSDKVLLDFNASATGSSGADSAVDPATLQRDQIEYFFEHELPLLAVSKPDTGRPIDPQQRAWFEAQRVEYVNIVRGIDFQDAAICNLVRLLGAVRAKATASRQRTEAECAAGSCAIGGEDAEGPATDGELEGLDEETLKLDITDRKTKRFFLRRRLHELCHGGHGSSSSAGEASSRDAAGLISVINEVRLSAFLARNVPSANPIHSPPIRGTSEVAVGNHAPLRHRRPKTYSDQELTHILRGRP